MRVYDYPVPPYDMDLYSALPPARLIKYCIDATRRAGEDDGLPADRLLREAGGVWMIARLRVNQYSPIRGREVLGIGVHDLGMEKTSFIRDLDITRGDEAAHGVELAAQARICYIVVSPTERKILRPGAVLPLWGENPPRPKEGLTKIHAPGELSELAQTRVRWADCDLNGHFSSSNYADLICEAGGYWANGPALMRELQIDFNAELKPGEPVILSAAGDGAYTVMRGVHADGAAGFTARYEVER